MRPVLLLVLAGLFACKPTAESWPKDSAKATCDFSERCATTNFYATYANKGECIDDNMDALEAEADAKSACLFDEEAAKECLKVMNGSCKKAGEEADTAFEPCFRIYDCPGEGDPTDTTTTSSR